MIKKNDILTTVEKMHYPRTIEVKEILPCGTKASCIVSDNTGDFFRDYEISELRYLSAKELTNDVFTYYNIEEPNYPFFSKDNIEWIKSEAQNYRDLREKILERCNQESIDIEDLPASDLWKFDQAAEIATWLDTLVDLIEKEVQEVLFCYK